VSGGQQATFGQGAVNVLGDETEGTMTGSSSTASPGSFGKSIFMRLRSKKIVDSATSRTLTGSALSGVQGAFGKTRTRPLTGSAASGATGTLVYTPLVPDPPPPSGELLVDEVASDTLLAGHNDVLWYGQFNSLSDIGGVYSGASDWYTGQQDWPTNSGHDNGSVEVEPTIGLNSIRQHSAYQPDHYLAGYGGTPLHRLYGTSGDGQTWQSYRKYPRQSSLTPTSDRHTPIGTDPMTEVWLRMGIYLESSIFTGMTEENGVKLGGFELNNIGRWMIMRFERREGTENGWRLECYWNIADAGSWGNGQWQGAHGGNWLGGVQDYLLYPDTWHFLEMHLKLNSSATASDGIREVWFDDKKIVEHLNCKTHSYTGSNPIEIHYLHNQIFHGGISWTPSSIIWARTTGWVAANRRIGKPKLIQPLLVRNLNHASWTTSILWTGSWNQAGTNGSQRTDMQYSNAHQHTNGRQLEFSRALHDQPAGDNTGVRWADFDSHRPPSMGYYWSNADTNIIETDNMPTAYLPWKGWVALFGDVTLASPRKGMKIISIDGTPSAIFRNNDGSGQSITDYVDITYPTGTGLTVTSPSNSHVHGNYNPACWVNPSGTMTGWWGGGYGSNYPLGVGSLFKLIDDNPNYPATSTKPLRLRVFRPTGKPSPTHMRHMVQIGNWLYWGGGYINPDTGTVVESTKLSRTGEFYRIYVPDLANNVFTQEQITSAPTITLYPNLPNVDNNVRFNLLCADQTRNWLIYMNINGVHRYKVPSDDGNDGTWETFTFGMTANQWASTISDGAVDAATSANWHGLIGTHRADLGKNGMTFFRYNSNLGATTAARRWNRIEWSA
jgi:hypothetical protein